MNILLYPTYFPSISHYVAMLQASSITFEVEDNFQKQTNRNRMYIYSPNGVQLLNIPIKHSKEAHQKYKDVRIENDFGWQKNHFKSLEAAYRTSPFFEYFEDDFIKLYSKKEKFLVDFNIKCIKLISNLLDLDLDYKISSEYVEKTNDIIDLRDLSNARKQKTIETPKYIQVFESKHGYLNNLSILDLIFSEGTNSVLLMNN